MYKLRMLDYEYFVNGDPGSLNPELGLDQQIDLLPYDKKFEVPRQSIIMGMVFGII